MIRKIKIAFHNSLRLFPKRYSKFLFEHKKQTNDSIIQELKNNGIAKDVFALDRFQSKGDTCFILGSGASLNELSTKDWEEVKSNFSIGFNYSFLLDHKPDLYFIELAKEDRGLSQRLLERKEFYLKIPVVIKGLVTKSKLTWASSKVHALVTGVDAMVLRESVLPTNSSKALKRGLTYVYDQFNKGRNTDFLVQSKASISMMIDVATKLGYQKIVLLGIDLHGPYFYEQTETSIETGQTAGTLLIQNSSGTELSIAEILKIQSEFLKKNKGVQLYAGSKISLLREFMPIYSFE